MTTVCAVSWCVAQPLPGQVYCPVHLKNRYAGCPHDWKPAPGYAGFYYCDMCGLARADDPDAPKER